MKRSIKQVAVLGSGVMGSRIAALFAGIDVKVLLLDMVPEAAKSSDDKKLRNKIVNDSLQAALKSNPSPIYHKSAVSNITTGNFTDDLKRIAECDWIIEVVIERLDIKQQLYAEVERFRKAGTLITSNTSGIPIHLLAEGHSEDFCKNFCGTHFFNPPRYLPLLEIIPTPQTDAAVVDFLMHYGDVFLGKTTVLAKDTPAFIANRIGVFSIMAIFHLMDEMKLSIDEIDALTGTLIGHPKSATFRTADVVGIDTLVRVADGVRESCKTDESVAVFEIPDWLKRMIENKWLGDKTGQGFFKKTKSEKGKEILSLNLNTFEYEPRQKPKFASVEAAKNTENLADRLRMLMNASDKAGQFFKKFQYWLFSYVSHRIPEISNEVYRVDDAMKAGFGWETGPFETWDILGVADTLKGMQDAGFKAADWVHEMVNKGIRSFFKYENGKRHYYDIASGTYRVVPGSESILILNSFKDALVWKNSACKMYDIGDGIAGFEWNTKMNTIGGEVLEGLNKAITVAEQQFNGLVIANETANFSAGANVGMIFMLAIEQEYDELDLAIRMFQNTMMRVRYSSVPVVIAPHGLTLGGGCEMNLHADAVCAAAETYIGLVELGVGLIPGGGGTKEFALRAAAELHDDEPENIPLKNRFLTIATAKVATSAVEAFDLGILRKGTDSVIINKNRRIAEAKATALLLANRGYTMPVQKNNIRVLGRAAMGAMYAGINGMWRAGFATDHDALVARKLAYVMCGGDLSEQQFVSEQYLLNLEREAFLSLCGEKKTLQRLESVLKTGKPVRN